MPLCYGSAILAKWPLRTAPVKHIVIMQMRENQVVSLKLGNKLDLSRGLLNHSDHLLFDEELYVQADSLSLSGQCDLIQNQKWKLPSSRLVPNP